MSYSKSGRKQDTVVEGFFPIIDSLLKKYGVVGAAVFGKMWSYARKSGFCSASQGRLAKELKLSRHYVNNLIKIFVEDGYLEDLTPERRNAAHYYSLTGKAKLVIYVKAVEDGSVTVGNTGVTVGNTGVTVGNSNILLNRQENRPIHEEATSSAKKKTDDAVSKEKAIDFAKFMDLLKSTFPGKELTIPSKELSLFKERPKRSTAFLNQLIKKGETSETEILSRHIYNSVHGKFHTDEEIREIEKQEKAERKKRIDKRREEKILSELADPSEEDV